MLTIEVGDTVRYTGKRTRWEVAAINDMFVEVIGTFERGRNIETITRNVHPRRIELVRKGSVDRDYADAAVALADANDAYAAGRASQADVDAARARFDPDVLRRVDRAAVRAVRNANR